MGDLFMYNKGEVMTQKQIKQILNNGDIVLDMSLPNTTVIEHLFSENQMKLIETLKKYVKDKKVSDKDFRMFVKNALDCEIL